jgi:hypothetical protein
VHADAHADGARCILDRQRLRLCTQDVDGAAPRQRNGAACGKHVFREREDASCVVRRAILPRYAHIAITDGLASAE